MRFFLVALLLIATSASAENLNDIPLYGGFPKTPSTIRADQRFIEKAVQAAGSKEAALDKAITRGWQHLRSGQTIRAIQRFNQAYLLDSESADVYWGLGAAVSQSGQYDESLRLFNRAYVLAPKDVRLVADIGLARTRFALGKSSKPAAQTKRLEAALLWFDVAERIDPGYPTLYANRAITLTFLNRYQEAWKNIAKAEALDQYSVDRSLIEQLSKAYPRPENTSGERHAKSSAQTIKEPNVPQYKLQPRVREVAKTSGPRPAPVTPLPPVPDSAPGAASASADTLPAPDFVKAEVVPGPPALESVVLAPGDEESQDEAQQPSPRRLHVIGGKPIRTRGSDKRDCLSLPTNDEIIRCVYPPK